MNLDLIKEAVMKQSLTFTVLRGEKAVEKIEGTAGAGSTPPLTYAEMVSIFGKPSYKIPSADKTTRIEWVIEFSNGEIATIYDYDDHEHLKYSEWLKTPYEWHIGGDTKHHMKGRGMGDHPAEELVLAEIAKKLPKEQVIKQLLHYVTDPAAGYYNQRGITHLDPHSKIKKLIKASRDNNIDHTEFQAIEKSINSTKKIGK